MKKSKCIITWFISTKNKNHNSLKPLPLTSEGFLFNLTICSCLPFKFIIYLQAMNLRILLLLTGLTFWFTPRVSSQNIQVNDTYTAQQLIENVLVNSPCAQVSNFSVSGGNFSSGNQSYGYFTNTNPAFPFTDGIVLSTGQAINAIGPNTSILSDNAAGWGADTDLNQALMISNSLNATVLEFDFVPKSSKLSFDYIFASEEYHGTASCTYSDGFAFLLKKAGTSDPYQNLAVIPHSNIPVKVTSVHPDVPGACPAQNPEYFGGYNGPAYPTNFNGQTVVMKAEADVIAGTTYHIKLVIADEANFQYDSAIFLGGGSFNADLNLGPDRTVANGNPLCEGETMVLDATQTTPATYKWFKDGVDTGITTPQFTITDNTNTSIVAYSVEVTNASCTFKGTINIQFSPLPALVSQTLAQCDDNTDGITTYNLTKLDALIKNNDPNLGTVTYSETPGGVPIATPTAYTTAPRTIYAEVANTYGCKNTTTVVLQIQNNTYTPVTYEKCDDTDGTVDGITQINLATEITPHIPTSFPIEYYATPTEAVLQSNLLPNLYTNNTANSQTIYARILDGKDCESIVTIHLTIHTFTPANFGDETLGICYNSPLTLSVPNTFSSYTWSTGSTSFSTVVSAAGTYTVQVTDAQGCKATKTFLVTASGIATNVDAIVEEFSDQNSITVTYTSNGGDYVFSIDGVNYQSSPFFPNLEAGEYTIYVKDLKGCLPIVTKTVFVLDFPKFFTPNGDGFNDIWAIKNLDKKPNAIISVFNRYGKLLKQFNGNTSGWDGSYAGRSLPADDYWFTLTFVDGKTIKSHFTLKR